VEKKSIFETHCQDYPVFAGNELRDRMSHFFSPFYEKGGVFLLSDHNSEKYCLPVLFQLLPDLKIISSYSLQPGEQSKDISALEDIWHWMMGSEVARDSLLVNLGGGVVSDLGGFAASAYKRGISYANIPTTLIGQADAAIGGKTGINFQKVKNQLGAFHFPAAVFILPLFLDTLPERHVKSGLAELFKTSLLSGPQSWSIAKDMEWNDKEILTELIFEAVEYKSQIVNQDPFDQGIRKALNFGHTIGHALESFYNDAASSVMFHGEAVAAGIICESFLSYHYNGLTKKMLDEISQTLTHFFKFVSIEESHFYDLLKIMEYDKKKTSEKINFSLLESIGKPRINVEVSEIEITLSFNFFNQVIKDDQYHKK